MMKSFCNLRNSEYEVSCHSPITFMRMKKLVAFALFALLISASAATARVRRDASPEKTSTPPTSDQVTPTPTPVDQQRQELERLRQEQLIRDRVQSEVDRGFSRATILFNAGLVILILFPIIMVIGLWLLRRSVLQQIASERKNLLDQLRDNSEKQLAAEISTELKGQMQILQQETAAIRTETVTQITSLISEAQTVLEELRQQRDMTDQGVEFGDDQHYQIQSFAEHEIEPLNNNLSDLLDMVSEDFYEASPQDKELEFKSSSQVLDANDYLHQGNALFSEGRYIDANSAYSEAIKIDRDFAEARYQNARCYSIRGKVNLAIGNLQWAIDLNPHYKEIAQTDPAFDAIREDEQFKKMMNSLT